MATPTPGAPDLSQLRDDAARLSGTAKLTAINLADAAIASLRPKGLVARLLGIGYVETAAWTAYRDAVQRSLDADEAQRTAARTAKCRPAPKPRRAKASRGAR